MNNQLQVLWQLNQRFKSKRDLYNYLGDQLVSFTLISCQIAILSPQLWLLLSLVPAEDPDEPETGPSSRRHQGVQDSSAAGAGDHKGVGGRHAGPLVQRVHS